MTVSSDANARRKDLLKVLIVDADIKNVQQFATVLRGRGCEPLMATTFEEAKRLLVEQHPEMLVADVRLGQFNGLQLLLRARTDRPDVTALITSHVADEVLEAETRRFGGTFVVKPVDPEMAVAMLLASRPPARPEPFVERRIGDRRHQTIPDFLPDRRLSDRRLSR